MGRRDNDRRDEYASQMISAEDAFCSIDRTKCDGVCREKYLNNGFVGCEYAVLERAVLSKWGKIKKGYIKKRRSRDDDWDSE